MRKGTLAILAALFLLVGLVGCSNPEAAVVGDWKQTGSTDVTTLKADHTASSSGKQKMEATWSLSGKQVKIKISKIGEQTIDQVMKQLDAMKTLASATPDGKKKFDAGMKALSEGIIFTLSDDGKTMSSDASLGTVQTLTKVDKTS